jgi:hypothetical protein
MTDQEKVDKINNVLKAITDALEQDMPANKFTFEREYVNWNVRYILYKDSVKQNVIMHYDFIVDVILGLYPVGELIAACKYELERTDK